MVGEGLVGMAIQPGVGDQSWGRGQGRAPHRAGRGLSREAWQGTRVKELLGATLCALGTAWYHRRGEGRRVGAEPREPKRGRHMATERLRKRGRRDAARSCAGNERRREAMSRMGPVGRVGGSSSRLGGFHVGVSQRREREGPALRGALSKNEGRKEVPPKL